MGLRGEKAGSFVCPGTVDVGCNPPNSQLPLHYDGSKNNNSQYVYMFVDGNAGDKVQLNWEIDSAQDSCKDATDLAKFPTGMTSNYMKARKTPLAMCTSSTIKGKMVPEEVFTVKVKAGATINLTVTAFETTVGNTALIDARWGGSCSVSGGAGANKIACVQSTKSPSAAWSRQSRPCGSPSSRPRAVPPPTSSSRATTR